MKNLILFLFLLLGWCANPSACSGQAQSVVINEVYGAGGNAGAVFTHDYIELYNNSGAAIDLTGWSIQYASAAATGTWAVTPLTGTIEPGRHFLIQLGAGSGNGVPLPTPDVMGTTAMAASAGKVALVNVVAALSGNCPAGSQIVDKVGYGSSATCFEGAGPTAAPSATLSVVRQPDGLDTNNNSTDFRTSTPNPQHSFPRAQTISFNALADKTYGDNPFSLIASASSGLPVTFESSQPSVASVSGNTLTIQGAGDVEITARQSGNASFMPAAATQTLHINKAPLAVSVDPVTRRQGDPNPDFSIHYVGFVGADSEAQLDQAPVAACAADVNSIPGVYPITLSGGQDDNYVFSYTNGQLTITPTQTVSRDQVLSPADGATEVVLDARFKAPYVPGATTYFMQLSKDPAFATFTERQGGRAQYFDDLDYATQYYLRMRTDLTPAFGPATRFVTTSPDRVTVLKSPPPNALGVGLSPFLRFDEVKGATQFSFELSEVIDFTSVLISQSGPRSQLVRGLAPGTTYYVRAKTELSPVWGPVRSFRTATLNDLCYVKGPGIRSERVSWLPEFTLNDVGAAAYTVQVSEADDFVNAKEYVDVPARFVATEPLKFRTLYYSRARAAAVPDGWGPVRTFVTAHPADYAVLKFPVEGSVVDGSRVRLGSAPVPGASTWSVALSRDPNFAATDTVITTQGRSGMVSLPPATWYARVRTDLSEEWGRITNFSATSSGPVVASAETAVSPNPFNDQLAIRLTEDVTQVTAVSFTGEVVYAEQHEAGTIVVGESWLPGIYVLRLTGKETKTIRVVKK